MIVTGTYHNLIEIRKTRRTYTHENYFGEELKNLKLFFNSGEL